MSNFKDDESKAAIDRMNNFIDVINDNIKPESPIRTVYRSCRHIRSWIRSNHKDSNRIDIRWNILLGIH